MLLDDEVLGDSPDELSDFVPAVVARSADEAEQYRELLDDHDIPAIIGTDEDLPGQDDNDDKAQREHIVGRGIPVLVPGTLLDEASGVIADRQEFNNFLPGEHEFEAEDDDDELALGEGQFGVSESELFDEKGEFRGDVGGTDEAD